MINIAMILGGAAIGGAIGLLGRYHDNKAKKEYERGYKDGYMIGKNLYTYGVGRSEEHADYELLIGERLHDAHVLQTRVKNCAIDIYYKRNSLLRLTIRHGERKEKHLTYILSTDNDTEESESEWRNFKSAIDKIEHEEDNQ